MGEASFKRIKKLNEDIQIALDNNDTKKAKELASDLENHTEQFKSERIAYMEADKSLIRKLKDFQDKVKDIIDLYI